MHFVSPHVIFILFLFSAISSLSAGFHLPLIHRDSGVYRSNLTTYDLHLRLLNYSESRLLWLNFFLQVERPPPNIRSRMEPAAQGQFGVQLQIGTPPVQQKLNFDTANDMIWIQCHPYQRGFPQDPPHFWPSQSYTLSDVNFDNAACRGTGFGRDGDKCSYTVNYNDGFHTKGLLKRDAFTFLGRGGGLIRYHHIAFGCSMDTSEGIFAPERRVAGMLGMSQRMTSLPSQLDIGKRFSYCLSPVGITPANYLRFGDSIPLQTNARYTTIRDYRDLPSYYVDLIDLSFNNHRLNLPPQTFVVQLDQKSGGCRLDTHSYYSYIIKPAYQALIPLMDKYFQQLGVKPVRIEDFRSLHCYALPDDRFNKFPTVTLHFAGVDLPLSPLRLWAVVTEKGFFCLGLCVRLSYLCAIHL